jgi:glycine hydroxymethyltransferase
MADFLFRGKLAKLDPEVFELTRLEAERQARKLILIPSESSAPLAVREAMASAFQNIYAEGYPDEESRWMTEEEILDYPRRLAHYRRSGDPRYYKGVEYADAVEALARRRAAEAFAANGYTADQIYVNVQALSGAPANISPTAPPSTVPENITRSSTTTWTPTRSSIMTKSAHWRSRTSPK